MCTVVYTAPNGAPTSFWMKGIQIVSGKPTEVPAEVAGVLKRDFPGIEVKSGDPVLPAPPLSGQARKAVARAVEQGNVQVVVSEPVLPAALSEKAAKLVLGSEDVLVKAIAAGELAKEKSSVVLACHLLGKTKALEALA